MANKKTSKSTAARFLGFLWKNAASRIDDFLEVEGPALNKSKKYWLDTVSQLKKGGAIELADESQTGTERRYRLTPKGKLKAASLHFDRRKLKKLAGERRLIVFDVPEGERLYRDYFRQVMKDLGCEMIQLSVWQADFELPEDFLRLVKELDLQHKVIVYKVRPEEILYL